MASEVQDMRTPAEKAADMELQQLRIEFMQWGEELSKEGCTEREVVGCFCSELEDRLARTYREPYEVA